MPQSATNEVITMAEPSNHNSSATTNTPGHRSTQRASTSEGPTPIQKPHAEPSTEVFAVYGVEPEIQAYAMAKYSRSALSMKESLREISSQKAEKVSQHVLLPIWSSFDCGPGAYCVGSREAFHSGCDELADEQRWDGQERSTRYQDFKKSGYYVPRFRSRRGSPRTLSRDAGFLFAEYEALSAHMTQHLISITPKPADMKQEAYERTLKARAFDITRYLFAAGHEYFAGGDRQCADAGGAGSAFTLTYTQGNPDSRRVVEESGNVCRLQRECRIPEEISGGKFGL